MIRMEPVESAPVEQVGGKSKWPEVEAVEVGKKYERPTILDDSAEVREVEVTHIRQLVRDDGTTTGYVVDYVQS